jgi:hypothetical protein
MKKNDVKIEGNTISGTAEGITNMLNKVTASLTNPFEIKAAALKEGFCNYSYEHLEGVTAGDACKRSGASIVHDDMIRAFNSLDVHLAVICEEILPAEIDIDNLPDYMDENLEKKARKLADRIHAFTVSAFRVEGSGENEGVVLTGTKKLTTGEIVKLETPKVKFISDYGFIQELMAAVTVCKNEVTEYMNGKAAPKMVQAEMFDDGEDMDHPE